jgi:hypothetical protein
MINANELRIGNWVTYKGQSDRIERNDFAQTYLDRYEPIPITSKILKKCGFEKQEDGDGGYYHELLSENGVLFIEGDKKGYTDVFIDMWENIRVRYLHQLQNLYFALTNSELKIDKL